ncbi:MAG: GTP-binding protein [Firmicutes bacterium]|nr:GTP-binding protein [Bacillota bacterium]
MKVLIVSGFLGAGKTTFIKELIKKTEVYPVVLENEYGDNDLDKRDLANSSEGELKILEFMEGCVCCTKKDTFLNSILAISSSLDPEYLIVEPTGVGKLGNILENVQAVVYDRIELLPPVVVLCPQSFNEYVRDYPDIYRNQIENAGVVVFSKHENADSGFLSLIADEIHKIRPDLAIQRAHYSHMDKAWFMKLLAGGSGGNQRTSAAEMRREYEEEQEHLDEVSIRGMTFASPGNLVSFLQSILMGRFGNIVRAKGVAKAGKELIRFDLADSTYAVKEEDSGSAVIQAVFIGRNLDGEGLRKAGNVKPSSALAEFMTGRK